ncbi:filamentous haemagglutinin family protein [Prosthecobacter vanneervenii]|uniref:Filamentous hemagglutinin family protein n=1 Tax=Prosthecobacter vanneervenii TaxID=48466 RepID=A0A7W7Y6R9_9BACT|nr:filamentous haemagglutinin family protein [Prosthecobacter vanneervenii]MBB5030643.1 filamentous hemagglutinin family protein [Prosthecobacter vanneervenii]
MSLSSSRRRRAPGEFSLLHRATALIAAFTLLPGPIPVAFAVDILRHGISAAAGTSASQTSSSGAGSGSSADSTAAARQDAADAITRTDTAIQAVQAMQNAAHALALTVPTNNLGPNPNAPGTLPDVPDGLAAGGLVLSGTPAGASSPTQTTSGGNTTVNIVQSQQQAFINWSSFNVGKHTTLNFDQSAGGSSVGQWIAFNKVTDPTGNPSQILGSITAQGQVYVINQNGIIFGGSSQVNVNTLVASTLPINDNLVSSGLLNQTDVQFLFSALPQAAGANGTPATTPPPVLTPSGNNGDITVQAGAQLTSPSVSGSGGRIALIAPNVTNNGSISTPDGQTIIAGGLQVGFTAHSSSDPSLRGLDVYVGSVGSYGGTVTNTGIINAPRGNVTMTGKEVNQNGVITSTTSVALNGRIDLNASYDALSNAQYNILQYADSPAFLYRSSGTVSVGTGAVTRILPEWASTETVVGTQLALVSQVNVTGKSVYFGGGSTLLAPNAKVGVSAGIWDYLATVDNVQPGTSTFTASGGQIYVDSGAMLNVAGSTDVYSSVSKYILTVQLRSNELANSPLQRTGVLNNQTVTVDLRNTGTYNGRVWYGTPLADLAGYVGVIQRTVGELTTAGGSISLNAGGSVVVQPSAKLDVSGGWINYQGAQVQTTQLVYNGQIINIATATPDLVYSGIYTGQTTTTQSAFGASSTTTSLFGLNNTFQPGYLQGGNGGSLSISAPAMALDGGMYGYTVSGPIQRSSPATASSLNVTMQSQQGTTPYTVVYPSGVTVYLRPGGTQSAVAPFAVDAADMPLATLSTSRATEVNLSPELASTFGFGRLTISNPNGNIVLPAGSALDAGAFGSVILKAANLDIEGSIFAASGTITLTAYDIAPDLVLDSNLGLPAMDPTRGHITLGSTAVLAVNGQIVDQRSEDGLNAVVATQGGSIKLDGMTVSLAAGGLLDVSGGVLVSNAAVVSYGSGGTLTVKSGQDATYAGVVGGGLTLGAMMRGFSGSTGGTLNLQAPVIQVGGATADPSAIVLDPSFLSQSGFNTFKLTGLGELTGTTDVFTTAVRITSGTVIAPVVQNYVALLTGGSVTLTPQTLAMGVRQPVKLDFEAPGVVDGLLGKLEIRGEIIMESGAVIQTDPLGSVTFNGGTVAIFGSVSAPGGTITVTGESKYPDINPNTIGLITVDLASGSSLSTAGTLLLTPSAYGLRKGHVLGGGTITISGNIAAEAGAVLDASGASGVLDLTPLEAGQSASNSLTNGTASGLISVATRIDSSGGTISFKGSEMLFLDAALSAHRGGATAEGGTLLVSSGRFYNNVVPKPDDLTIVVTQNTASIPTPLYTAGGNATGKAVRTAGGALVEQMGYFQADTFQNGGFDALTISGNVQFSGPISLNAPASLSIGSGGVITTDSTVSLSAPYVDLGMAFRAPIQSQQPEIQPYLVAGSPYYVAPTYGTGSLNVSASMIDVGNLVLKNTGALNLTAANGDIRGNGTLNVAGNITLTAGQVYAPTAVNFMIAAYDYTTGGGLQNGTVTFVSSGLRNLPISAGSTLSVYASIINQGGTIVAPAGTINLGWDGTGTTPQDLLSGAGAVVGRSIPITKNLNLLSGSRTSVSQIDPITGQGVVIPYGYSSDGTTWIDPKGVDISGGGLPVKLVNTAALNIAVQNGALVDLRGGGDLYAYRWVSGTGGTVDILASQGSFAVLPGYAFGYAPFASFNNTSSSLNLASGESGYTNGTLSVGDRVYLAGGSGLAAGVYTLLPARFALLAGAYLVTPKSGEPLGSALQPDGASLVSGYQFNGLNAGVQPSMLYSSFEVAPASVVSTRAQYTGYNASTYLQSRAQTLNLSVPLLPQDAGSFVLESLQTLSFSGQLLAAGGTTGRGAEIDISSPSDILIATAGTSATPGVLVLDAAQLSSFGAESLLIGGQRTTTTAGTQVSVRTGSITVGNSSASTLSMPELILVANGSITVNAGASISQSGSMRASADTLRIGTASNSGSGEGVLLRVSADTGAQVLRAGVTSATAAALTIAAGASISGASVILDSTNVLNLNPSALVTGQSLNINSGRISVQLNNPGSLQPNPGLVLAGTVLQNLQQAKSLSLLSYSTIDIYGVGQLGAAQMSSLALRAGEIRGFNNSSSGVNTVTLTAQKLQLDNFASAAASGAVAASTGSLVLNALDTMTIGANTLQLNQFNGVSATASNGIIFQGTGGLVVSGDFSAVAPVITAAGFASQSLTATGALTFTSSAAAGTLATGGLGASLTLTGGTVATGADIELASGNLTVKSTTGDTTVTGTLNVGGTAQTFFDQVKYTDAGKVTLISATGNVNLLAGSMLNISANSLGGDAGTLTVTTASGTLNLGGTISGTAPQGQSGSFVLTAGSLPSLGVLNNTLNSAGLNNSRSIRVLGGDVAVDGYADSHTFNLSADQGSIVVSGAIDASGTTGGSILLAASGSIVLSAGQTQATTADASGNVITLGSATGVSVGQAVTGVNVPSGTYVTAVNGTQITLNRAVTSTVPASTTLTFGGRLTAAAATFDSAGKGGNISLMAGSERNGVINTSAVLDLRSGTQIDLSVAGNIPSSKLNVTANVATNVAANLGGYDTITSTQAGVITLTNGQTVALAANTPTSVIGAKTVTLSSNGSVSFAGSSAWGLYTGTLQLRAPQNASANNLQMNAINAQISGASLITAEGYKIFTPASGTLNATVLSTITTNATTFTGNTATITNALFASNPDAAALRSVFYLLPGAEVLNLTGNLTLGTATSTISADWNLAGARFGPSSVPGILTMRAAGNLVFFNSLNDGFATGAYNATMSALNATLPTNLQSWSYRLASGSDFTAVDFHQVVPQTITGIAATTGSLMLGRNAGAAASTNPGSSINTNSVVNPTTTTGRFQVIRTGTGSIEIATGGDVQFLNQFASIYTAGAQVANSTMAGTFNVPRPNMSGSPVGGLGAVLETTRYPAQFTMGGGNVNVNAQGSIIQLTKDTSGNTIADSKRSMPTNWLFRRGAVDPTTGVFARSRYDQSSNPDVASTSWWVDFANFFENFGALGGGNITLVAGRDVSNVNAVIPTNARMQGTDTSGNPIAPNAANMVELGGGSLLVQSGRNIDGGVYYVERGTGTLNAGASIVTNSTRSPSLGILSSFSNPSVLASDTWLPTTLFVGKSKFSVKAVGDVLLGPVANPFLLPQGYNNSYWYKTYFSTYSVDSGVSVSSLAGDVTLRQSVTLPSVGAVPPALPMLEAWFMTQLLLSSSKGANGGLTSSNYQPWLKLDEDDVSPFNTAFTVMPGTLNVTAFTGSLNVVGTMNLSPSPTGTLDLLVAGSVNGLSQTGVVTLNNVETSVWNAGWINLSDADPSALIGITTPFAYQTLLTSPSSTLANTTQSLFLQKRLDAYFNETGSTSGSAAVLQTKQALHAPGLLHATDTKPARIYAKSGSINGFTFFSAKSAQVISGQDIADVSLYLQNNRATDLSIVAAGRDIIPYNASTPLRVLALSAGNITGLGEKPQAGDIQINGPGALEVLSGRNLDLGVGSNNADGTGVGITSIGNGRNPYLPFAGADIVAAAGLGGAAVGISNASSLNFTNFINSFGTSPAGSRYLTELAEALGVPSINLNSPTLTADQKSRYALALFYLVLRDAGRDHNNPDSPNYKTYDAGFQAISALFPATTYTGTINTQSRDIRTKSGGDISLLAPGGGLQLSPTAIGTQLAPPGIITEAGGGINIFANKSVDIGISRIFTLKGGDITIWSSTGNIAAGSSAKTVQSAPPTRVIIDPQSASVSTDLAGLATGGGIGALATIANIKPANIDLIAPVGAVDAGDAGIRATGNLNIAATVVLNSSNIQVAGSTSGAPSAPSVAAPNISGLSSAASSTAATSNVAAQQQQQQQQTGTQQEDTPSIITVEVLGYGGGSGDDDEKKRNQPGE